MSGFCGSKFWVRKKIFMLFRSENVNLSRGLALDRLSSLSLCWSFSHEIEFVLEFNFEKNFMNKFNFIMSK
jgi:hypothetical protein